MIEQDEIIEYNSLNEIRLRKELLRKDIQADDAKIKALWKSLEPLMVLYFHGYFISSSREKDKA